MARYQVLYWRHIPLGVKATDLAGTIRKNMPARFQQTFQETADRDRKNDTGPFTTSGFRWEDEQEREGSAGEVAGTIIQELIESWDAEEALATFRAQRSEFDKRFIDLKRLDNKE